MSVQIPKKQALKLRECCFTTMAFFMGGAKTTHKKCVYCTFCANRHISATASSDLSSSGTFATITSIPHDKAQRTESHAVSGHFIEFRQKCLHPRH